MKITTSEEVEYVEVVGGWREWNSEWTAAAVIVVACRAIVKLGY